MSDKKPIIKATTPNSKKYDTKIDVYTNNPRGEHKSIHVAVDSNTKSAHITFQLVVRLSIVMLNVT